MKNYPRYQILYFFRGPDALTTVEPGRPLVGAEVAVVIGVNLHIVGIAANNWNKINKMFPSQNTNYNTVLWHHPRRKVNIT